ncbi:MAG: hypothetical protein O2799_01805 [Planctomycetota bacterium]|nr:hypothetical protein [Planctomycetota bacterium]
MSRVAALRRDRRSPKSAHGRARRVWRLLALPLALCLLVTGPAHIAFHGHGSAEACDHSHAAGPRAQAQAAQAQAAQAQKAQDQAAQLQTASHATEHPAAHEPTATVHGEEASAAAECGLCLFAGAPVAGAPAHPDLRTEPPSWAPGTPSPCFGGDALELPAPRGPPALG